MWKNQVLVWENTEHAWNNFGENTILEIDNEDDLYAKGLVTWKKTTLGDFIKNLVAFAGITEEFIKDQNLLTGFAVAIAAAALFPFNLSIIKDDNDANQFISLLHREKDNQYILKSEFKNSNFGDLKSINTLISNLIADNVLLDLEDRYIVNGKVLNGAHLLN